MLLMRLSQLNAPTSYFVARISRTCTEPRITLSCRSSFPRNQVPCQPMERGERIPTLDGWRGIAILMVMAFHAQYCFRLKENKWLALGSHGVPVFFVLSGYLITSKLMDGPIEIKNFYVRRFFRLTPVAWSYLAFVSFFAAISHAHVIRADLWACVFFFRNYCPPRAGASELTGHFWSLSIEEQFYLVWPAVLFFSGRTRALWFAGLGFVLSVLMQFHFAYDGWRALKTGNNAHFLLAGCMLALVMPGIADWVRDNAYCLLCGAILLFIAFPWRSVEAVTIAAVLGATSARGMQFFEWRPLAFIGSISYSMYVWQQFFLIPPWGWVGVMLLPIVAVLSWGLIEKPCIRFGKSLLARKPEPEPVAA